MFSADYGLSVRSVAQLALVVSQSSKRLLDDRDVPSMEGLRQFWQSSRRLQKRWTNFLDDQSMNETSGMERLERLAPRVFVCEMLVRTWSTILASLDRQQGSEDLTTIARNVVSGLMQIRHRVMSALLNRPPSEHDRVLVLDRLRRRCDRWTDLLLGSLEVKFHCYEFAFDRERARDFGSDYKLDCSSIDQQQAIDRLMSVGMRMRFLQCLPSDVFEEPDLATLMNSIPLRA